MPERGQQIVRGLLAKNRVSQVEANGQRWWIVPDRPYIASVGVGDGLNVEAACIEWQKSKAPPPEFGAGGDWCALLPWDPRLWDTFLKASKTPSVAFMLTQVLLREGRDHSPCIARLKPGSRVPREC